MNIIAAVIISLLVTNVSFYLVSCYICWKRNSGVVYEFCNSVVLNPHNRFTFYASLLIAFLTATIFHLIEQGI